MKINKIIREEINDFEWMGDVDSHDSKMTGNQMVKHLEGILHGSRFTIEIDGDDSGSYEWSFGIEDDSGMYEDWVGHGLITFNDILEKVGRTAKKDLDYRPYVIEYRELYNTLVGYEKFPTTSKLQESDFEWIKEVSSFHPYVGMKWQAALNVKRGVWDEENTYEVTSIDDTYMGLTWTNKRGTHTMDDYNLSNYWNSVDAGQVRLLGLNESNDFDWVEDVPTAPEQLTNDNYIEGGRVKISKNSEYYMYDDSSNPNDVFGTILPHLDGDAFPITVQWDNDTMNDYNHPDLMLYQ